MSSAIKVEIVYFPVVGRAEVTRALLTLGGIEFTEEMVHMKDWMSVKDTLPFAQLPMIRVKDAASGELLAELTESSAIERFLAARTGHNGDNEFEDARIQAIRVQFEAALKAISIYYWSPDDQREKAAADVRKELAHLFKYHERILAKNGSNGHYVGEKLTVPDLFAAYLYLFAKREGFAAEVSEEAAPLFNKVVETTMAEPKLAEFYADVHVRNEEQKAADFPGKQRAAIAARMKAAAEAAKESN
ncbi:hypothetical protein GQ42DRAFT_144455 [Ramicandelaber brevisporus]|nr:hypothetical protein GQ42DRAFT_144455 [Ramicandelaber brevisporus]